MRTINFKFGKIKEMLSKDQMKQISGGSCTWTWGSGTGCAAGSSTTPGSGGSQGQADYWCSVSDCCDDVDCR